MMNGERGLVPSNFVERIAEDEVILKESDEIGIKIVGPWLYLFPLGFIDREKLTKRVFLENGIFLMFKLYLLTI